MSGFFNYLPRVGITVGDPAGIGAEVVLKAIADAEVRRICLPIVFADAGFLQQTAQQLGLPCDYKVLKRGDDKFDNFIEPVIYDLANVREKIIFGAESATTGRASADAIEEAVRLCLGGKINAIATAPISKRALALAGVNYPGHTEFLAHLSNTEEFAMSFFAGNLRVVLLSTHVSLRRAIELVKKDAVKNLILLANCEMKRLGIEKPRLAVAGLNPHAGEDRMFGSEEAEEINPAIEECRAMGVNVGGAFAADTVFWRAGRGDFDAVIACYHDQATIAVKSASFGESVNVTLGLPFVRTSVDHGTAFDIAGRNLAEHSSMIAAVKLAASLSHNHSNNRKKYANTQ